VAAVRHMVGGTVRREVRTFKTTTKDLMALSEWLSAEGCTHIAMGATGISARAAIVVNTAEAPSAPTDAGNSAIGGGQSGHREALSRFRAGVGQVVEATHDLREAVITALGPGLSDPRSADTTVGDMMAARKAADVDARPPA
jgi:hypothetical protein